MGWLKAILAFFGLGEKIAEAVHDHDVDVGGQNKVIAADNAVTAKAEHNAAQAMVNTSDRTVSDELRDGRF